MSVNRFCCPSCGASIAPYDIIPGFHKLSRQQADIMTILASNPGVYFTRHKIGKLLWADREDGGGLDGNIDVAIYKIRNKLGRDVILTKKTRGYALNVAFRPGSAIRVDVVNNLE